MTKFEFKFGNFIQNEPLQFKLFIIKSRRNLMKKSIEQTYQKKSPLEHVLLRPDTYVGSIEMEKSKLWVLPKDATQFEYRQITFVPALYKMFDEVLVNAADNYVRDNRMNLLKVEVNQEEGFVSVLNNGQGIPVEIHKDYNIYVPELIFGHLLTGSNYDDEEKKVVGGRNGYGAKLANIFSSKFIVECGDNKLGRKFKMIWTKNMSQHTQAEITKYSGKDYTSVTFYPDFKRFKMQKLDDDIFMLFTKRAYDMAGLMPKVKVVINGKDINANSFVKYVNMYFDPDSEFPKIRDNDIDNDRWQVVVSISEGEFRQVSFVNGICTSRGGTHVDYITNQIVQKIQEKIKKKDKNLNVKPFQIKAHLWVFINALIQNPTFDSQTKETLKLKASQFGSECILSEKIIKQILKSGIVDEIFNQAKAKQLSKLAKITAGGKKQRIQGIPKLQDANEAGSKNSQKCTLILTEGDSAKSLAMAGLEVIGRDYYGVFPLKGKLLNVREANNKTLLANEQIQNIIKILGLQIGKQYSDMKSLRYGAIMIMSDQDTDGSHIKGLVINFIHFFWPSLFKKNGFLKQFITPLLKAIKGRDILSFFTTGDFKNWSQNVSDLKRWKIKYYKGLGTSTDKEAKEYFQNIRIHKIDFSYVDREDDQCFQLVFSKKNVDKRKEWLHTYDPNITMEYDASRTSGVRYKQFVERQLIHFSNENNIRAIASVLDGFKPGQRKIIYACFKRNLKEEIKVAQLAGYVAEHSAYHHGQMSLTQTIVNMAQNFVGSNNINLLMPNGQFGSRNEGGKDHASARYIFTCLNRITRYIFPEADDHVLTYVQDDGQLVQPQYYVPIIPMGLVNGCEGIGTGWSTNFPNFNPRQIAELIIRKLDRCEPFTNIHPWYKGFIGQINPKSEDLTSYQVRGIVEVDLQSCIVHIRQLPVQKWIKEHKKFLQQLIEKDQRIVGLREYHTRLRVHFQIEVTPQTIEAHPDPEYYESLFKTVCPMSMKNMVGFNAQKHLHLYTRVTEVLQEFYEVRLKYYGLRKQYLLSSLKRDLEILTMKERFIIEVIEQKVILRNVKKAKIVQILREKGYTKYSEFTQVKSNKKHGNKIKKEGENQDENEEQGQNQNKKDSITEYNYLLSLPLLSLTYEKVEEIKKQKKEKENQYWTLQKTEISVLWKTDLLDFLKVLDEVERQQLEEIQKGNGKIKHDGKQKRARKKPAAKPKKQKQEKSKINWDTESEVSVQKQKAKEGKKGGISAAKNKNNRNSKDRDSTDKKNKKQSKGKKEKKGKQVNDSDSKTEVSSQADDLINRIKKKQAESQKTKQNESYEIEPVITTRPKKALKSMADIVNGENCEDYQFEQTWAKKSKKKNKFQIDSDEEYIEGEESDNSDK